MDSNESAITPDERGRGQQTRGIKLNGHQVTVTEVLDSYWHLTAETGFDEATRSDIAENSVTLRFNASDFDD